MSSENGDSSLQINQIWAKRLFGRPETCSTCGGRFGVSLTDIYSGNIPLRPSMLTVFFSLQ